MKMIFASAILLLCLVSISESRSVWWYVSSGQIESNTALVAELSPSALSGAYLCCGFGHVGAAGTWSGSYNATVAAAQLAPFASRKLPAWFVIGVSNESLAAANWAPGVASVAAAASALVPFGLSGFLVDYEPVTNYTTAHARAYGDFLRALCDALRVEGVSCGMDIADWSILGAKYWPFYVDAGVSRFTSMTPTYNAVNVTHDQVYVSQALAALPRGSYAAGVGSTIADASSCPMQYEWTSETFPRFVQWMGAHGVDQVDVWRCDIDKNYDPDPTAKWVIDALKAFVASEEAAPAAASPASSGGTVFSGDWIKVSVTGPTCDVTAFGAVGDGRANDTLALQKAITACTGASGGTVYFPAGKTFLSAALTVPPASNVAIVIDGTLRFTNDTKAWAKNSRCLTFEGGRSVALVGSGLVDGQGAAWWPARSNSRPGLVGATGVTEMLIANLTFIDSPNHSLEIYASPAEVVGVTVRAPASTAAFPSHNTDAIDVHGDYFWVHRCDFSVGDDNAAIHSSHVLVSDCVFGDGHGASIGSLGGAVALQNITVRDTVFRGTTTGARIKVDSKASGYLRDVLYANLSMEGVGETINLCFFYDVDGSCNWPGKASATTEMTMSLTNVSFRQINSSNAGHAGEFTCTAQVPCAGIALSDVTHTGSTKDGWACSNAPLQAVNNVSPTMPKSCGKAA